MVRGPPQQPRSSLAFDAYLDLLLVEKGLFKAEVGVLLHLAFQWPVFTRRCQC